VQSASIAARTANSAKVRANNINIVLMAIADQQFVSLQSENLFHYKSPDPTLRALVTKMFEAAPSRLHNSKGATANQSG